MLELSCGQDFDPARDEEFFAFLPERPGVFLLELRAPSTKFTSGLGSPVASADVRTPDLSARAANLTSHARPTSAALQSGFCAPPTG